MHSTQVRILIKFYMPHPLHRNLRRSASWNHQSIVVLSNLGVFVSLRTSTASQRLISKETCDGDTVFQPDEKGTGSAGAEFRC